MLNSIRIIFLVGAMGWGLLLGKIYSLAIYQGILAGLGIGLAFCIIEILFTRFFREENLIRILIGLIGGVIVASAINLTLGNLHSFIKVGILLFSIYLGIVAGIKLGEAGRISFLPLLGRKPEEEATSEDKNYKILDTSSIIDGRIAELCALGVIEGNLLIPRFILKELQRIADSPDTLKRNRGRRGLNILHKIQKSPFVKVKIIDTDFPEAKDVDTKLIMLSKAKGGKIITNDYNLNRIAQLENVQVLNIHELAEALRPIFLPGEEFTLNIVKEGKESNQGIGYLNDGTMVVVENGYNYIGQKKKVAVTSTLSSPSGRMIFTRIVDEEL
jgi:uncharacterized protein YacL